MPVARRILFVAWVGLVALATSVAPARTQEPSPSPFNDYDKPPTPTYMPRPVYPAEAFQKRIEGTVVVEIFIDVDGRVHPRRILTSVPALDAAAVDCVRHWTFRPATKDGKPVGTVAHAPIGFRIGDAPSSFAVSRMSLGRSVNKKGQIDQEAYSFALGERVYASIGTTGTGTAELRIRWSLVRGDDVAKREETTRTIVGGHPLTAEFGVGTTPSDWAGSYKLEVFKDGDSQPIATKTFEVR